MIRAGIDIGTNTALMVVADRDENGTYTVLADIHELPRLGEGLSSSGLISAAAIERARRSMQRFRSVLESYPNVRVRVVATSAMREARNGSDVSALLSAELGHPIEVISGQQEAYLTFLGSVGTSSEPTLMIDIGGGSTEYAIGVDGHVSFSTSIPIGAVKFTELFGVDRPMPVAAIRKASSLITDALAPYRHHLAPVQRCVGVAGTPVALAMIDTGQMMYEAQRLDGHVMSRARVGELSSMLCSLSLDQVRAIPGLHERRADIVPLGSVILHASLSALGIDAVEARTTGLRYGAMLEV